MGIIDNVIKRKRAIKKKIINSALKEANNIATILVKKFGAKEVILFGSLLEKKYFDVASDIDISVKGLGDKYYKAYGYCIRHSKFNLDIRAYEDMPNNFKININRKGLYLYGKKKFKKRDN